MVICIQREKKSGVHCPVTKKLEALTPPAIDRFLNRHIFCITTPASNTPSGRKKKASSAQHKFCWQERFKTVLFDKTQKLVSGPWRSLLISTLLGVIVCLLFIPPLRTWHANMTLHTITLLSCMRRTRPGHAPSLSAYR